MKFIQHHTQYMNSLLPSINSGPIVYEIRIHDPFNIDENFFKDVPKNTPLVINQGFEEYDLFKLKDYKGITDYKDKIASKIMSDHYTRATNNILDYETKEIHAWVLNAINEALNQ